MENVKVSGTFIDESNNFLVDTCGFIFEMLVVCVGWPTSLHSREIAHSHPVCNPQNSDVPMEPPHTTTDFTDFLNSLLYRLDLTLCQTQYRLDFIKVKADDFSYLFI